MCGRLSHVQVTGNEAKEMGGRGWGGLGGGDHDGPYVVYLNF